MSTYTTVVSKFQQNLGLLGSHVDGYKKLKSVIKLIENDLPENMRYTWDCELFGPESNEMLHDIDYELSKGHIGSSYDCSCVEKKEPIHHNYFMQYNALESFMHYNESLFDKIKETGAEPHDITTKSISLIALPTSYAVTKSIHQNNQAENNNKKTDTLTINTTHKKNDKKVIMYIQKWYNDIGFKTKYDADSMSLSIDMKNSDLKDFVYNRYKYLLIDKIANSKLIHDKINLMLSGTQYMFDISRSGLAEKCNEHISEIITDVDENKDKMNESLKSSFTQLQKILYNLQERETYVTVGFKNDNNRTVAFQQTSDPLTHHEARHLWHIFQPNDAYELFNQISYSR